MFSFRSFCGTADTESKDPYTQYESSRGQRSFDYVRLPPHFAQDDNLKEIASGLCGRQQRPAYGRDDKF